MFGEDMDKLPYLIEQLNKQLKMAATQKNVKKR